MLALLVRRTSRLAGGQMARLSAKAIGAASTDPMAGTGRARWALPGASLAHKGDLEERPGPTATASAGKERSFGSPLPSLVMPLADRPIPADQQGRAPQPQVPG
jgi:hypothetical protein